MTVDLEALFEDMENSTAPIKRNEIVKGPLPGYLGNKTKALENILPALPFRNRYVEVFGGSGAVLLNRPPAPLEVYNDRFGGVVDFYRCVRDSKLCQQLTERLELQLYGREEFQIAVTTWEDVSDTVERAARWYTSWAYSISKNGRTYGRSISHTGVKSLAIKHRTLMQFPVAHQRLQNVQIENLDWRVCLDDFDSDETVFYLDPPYLDCDASGYKHKFTRDEHVNLLEHIFHLKGFVALSGFPNPLYDSYPWDNRIEWISETTCNVLNATAENNKSKTANLEKRGTTIECLWIKE